MLTLPTKKKWFYMILTGEKLEEYRENKPYYTVRFEKVFDIVEGIPVSKKISQIRFTNGYGNNVPSFIADCHLEMHTGKEEWGAEKDIIYYVLHIHKIRWKSMDGSGGYLKSDQTEGDLQDVYTMNYYGYITIDIKSIMDKKGISRNKLARSISARFEVVDKWYNGTVERIDSDILAKICYVLDCEPHDIIKYHKNCEKE